MNRLASAALSAAIVLALPSCTAMSKLAGMGVIKHKDETFDGSHTIEVTPNNVLGEGAWPLHKIGGRWRTTSPDLVALTFSVPGGSSGERYSNLEAVHINIDGDISSYDMAGRTRYESEVTSGTTYTASRNSTAVELEYLRSMVESDNVTMRLDTSNGYIDTVFSNESSGGMPLARASLRQFLTEVDGYRAQLTSANSQ